MSSLAHQSGMVSASPALLFFHGETVTLTPSGGAAVEVKAVVLRDGLAPKRTDGGRTGLYPLTVLINIADLATPVLRGDAIALKVRRSDAANTTVRVVEVQRQDIGMWRLVVE